MLFAAGVIGYTLVWRPDSAIAETAVTFAFITLLGCLGIYQSIGTLDLRAMKKRDEE